MLRRLPFCVKKWWGGLFKFFFNAVVLGLLDIGSAVLRVLLFYYCY